MACPGGGGGGRDLQVQGEEVIEPRISVVPPEHIHLTAPDHGAVVGPGRGQVPTVLPAEVLPRIGVQVVAVDTRGMRRRVSALQSLHRLGGRQRKATRPATSVRWGNWFSVGIGPVPKAAQ